MAGRTSTSPTEHDPRPVHDDLLDRLRRDPRQRAGFTHVERTQARAGEFGRWPPWGHPEVIAAFGRRGIAAPWLHQQEAAELAWAGRHVVVATGTGSGKSLAYQLPVLSAVLTDPAARALYLSPTKALAGDQLRALSRFGLEGVRAARYDGDTSREDRDWARAYASVFLTNPDMLSRGILPRHARFRSMLRGLRFVVIDECHTYRGVFGSHVAQVLRRLRRLCTHYGADPVFVLASATVAEPARLAARLTGLPVTAVTADSAPRGESVFALYEPPLTTIDDADGNPIRRSATSEAAALLGDLVLEGARSLAFTRSRRSAEVVAIAARQQVAKVAPALAGRIAAYRGGFLAEERRDLETRLHEGNLLGVASTNALELGIDIADLDAVVLAGWPGTIASMRQQAGRAGRSGEPALAVFVAREDPLDTFLVHHPAAVFGAPIEAAVLDPSNEVVLAPHLECAAAELPLSARDMTLFEGSEAVVEDLVSRGRLRRRNGGVFWARHGEWPDADLRGSGGSIALIEETTGRLLGQVDIASADRTVHEGAVYLHQGETYTVVSLDLGAAVALLVPGDPEWTTTARVVTDLSLVAPEPVVDLREMSLGFDTVEVTSQVVSYLRRRIGSGEVLGETPLTLPPRQLRTKAVYVTASDDLIRNARIRPEEVAGAVHAAEHAAIGMLPLFATCDRWDVGGVSAARHPDTGRASIFVYDGHAGGAGFAAQGHAHARRWLDATRAAMSDCGCASGCPSCVHSPTCGTGNAPLDKAGGLRLLDALLGALA